jgi:hypothetical protein
VSDRTRRAVVTLIVGALVVLPLVGLLAMERVTAVGPSTDRPLAILLLGSDAGPPRDDDTLTGRADGFQLLFVSAERDRATFVSIPRDSWVPVTGLGDNKINACLTRGPRTASPRSRTRSASRSTATSSPRCGASRTRSTSSSAAHRRPGADARLHARPHGRRRLHLHANCGGFRSRSAGAAGLRLRGAHRRPQPRPARAATSPARRARRSCSPSRTRRCRPRARSRA